MYSKYQSPSCTVFFYCHYYYHYYYFYCVKPRFGINEIVTENGIVSDETSTANELNKYFVNILQQICKDNKARGGGYSHTLPIWVCVAQRGRDFKAPDLEWGIHFRGVF